MVYLHSTSRVSVLNYGTWAKSRWDECPNTTREFSSLKLDKWRDIRSQECQIPLLPQTGFLKIRGSLMGEVFFKHFGLGNYSNCSVTWHTDGNCYGQKNHQFQVNHKNLGKSSNIFFFFVAIYHCWWSWREELRDLNFLKLILYNKQTKRCFRLVLGVAIVILERLKSDQASFQ